jgi:NAD(P)-dependent dehydrogenase (short-subunit alcohol dehydrogenase family)
MELVNRNIVITGAGSGIGAAVARRFSAEGPRALVLADLDLPAVQAVADELGAVAVRADVGREEDILGLVERARDVGGPVDLFFSNAGVPGPADGPEAPDDEWGRAWRVNVMAHVWAARALLPEMIARGDGYLVNTASAAGVLTQVGALVYSVTKHAAVALAEWMSITYADEGVKVSCVCPMAVRTPMLELALEDRVGAAALLANEVLDPDDVAEAVLTGVREERLLIFPHASLAEYFAFKATDNERWLAGMRRLVRNARGGNRAQEG